MLSARGKCLLDLSDARLTRVQIQLVGVKPPGCIKRSEAAVSCRASASFNRSAARSAILIGFGRIELFLRRRSS
jgi:hypothetical protein